VSTSDVYTWTPDYTYTESVGFDVDIATFESGGEQRRRRSSLPLRVFNLSYKLLDQDEIDEIWDFYIARYGAWDLFMYRNYPNSLFDKGVVGTAQVGGQDVFNLAHFVIEPGVIVHTPDDVVSPQFYVDEVLTSISWNIDYDYTNGCTVTFESAVAAGSVVTAKYDFYNKVRFAEDKLSRELFAAMLYRSGVRLQEVV
jgi:hypothetical protein